jgi:MFS family permease
VKETVYRRYLLTVLLSILAFNYVDRLALGLVLQDIKVELHLSDTELGFLTGLAFAVFYSLMGLPIARWADRGDRVLIISLTTVIWSAAVALCGAIASFSQLLLGRIGVAVGEAGCIPPAHSLIADYFTRAERPRAVGTYMLGAPLSMVVGYFMAGWLNELYGWRPMFVILGFPGLVLSALAWFTLKEPRRRAPPSRSAPPQAPEAPPAAGESSKPQSFRTVLVTLSANVTFRHLLFCFAVSSFFGYGILQWQPAFFVRSFGLKTGELGSWLALIYGVGGLLGTHLGGAWASRLAANKEALQLQTMAVIFSSLGVFSVAMYLAPNRYWAFGWLAFIATAGALINGPLFATIQTLVPQRMRAMSIAMLYLFANLIGMGLGPLVAGALSDAFRHWAGEESLRYALLTLCPGYLWSGWHLWRASRTVERDLNAAVRIDQD